MACNFLAAIAPLIGGHSRRKDLLSAEPKITNLGQGVFKVRAHLLLLMFVLNGE